MTRVLLYTYATPRPVGTRARSLHVGTPAHVCTVNGRPVNNLRARWSLYYITHSTDKCFARRYYTAQCKAHANKATESNDDDHDQSAEPSGVNEKSFILDSGAQPTHTATLHAIMHPNTGTLTQTATGQRVRITHSGNIGIQAKNKKIRQPAVHTPHIKQNLFSVHDLTAHGHVTFTRTHAYRHAPTKLLPARQTLTASRTRDQPKSNLLCESQQHPNTKTPSGTPHNNSCANIASSWAMPTRRQ